MCVCVFQGWWLLFAVEDVDGVDGGMGAIVVMVTGVCVLCGCRCRCRMGWCRWNGTDRTDDRVSDARRGWRWLAGWSLYD